MGWDPRLNKKEKVRWVLGFIPQLPDILTSQSYDFLSDKQHPWTVSQATPLLPEVWYFVIGRKKVTSTKAKAAHTPSASEASFYIAPDCKPYTSLLNIFYSLPFGQWASSTLMSDSWETRLSLSMEPWAIIKFWVPTGPTLSSVWGSLSLPGWLSSINSQFWFTHRTPVFSTCLLIKPYSNPSPSHRHPLINQPHFSSLQEHTGAIHWKHCLVSKWLCL